MVMALITPLAESRVTPAVVNRLISPTILDSLFRHAVVLTPKLLPWLRSTHGLLGSYHRDCLARASHGTGAKLQITLPAL
jgi:hypothetical protein